jgi:hypothetical protein
MSGVSEYLEVTTMVRNAVLATVVALLLTVGSGAFSAPSAQSVGRSWVRGTAQGVYCEVRGDGSSSNSVGEGYYEFIAGRNKLRMHGGHITANGREYGLAKAGDRVLVDADGTVRVNGKLR